MKSPARMAFILLALGLPGLAMPQAAAAVPKVVHDIRYSVSGEVTRVVVDLSQKIPYEVVPFTRPERIAINIRHAQPSKGLRSVTIPDGVVRRIRTNRLSWGFQIVLDLRGEAAWSDFHLARVEGFPDRIVLDVSASAGQGSPPPLAVDREPAVEPREVPTMVRRRHVIAVDAGHGGTDPGAIGRGRLVEKHVAFDIARRVCDELGAYEGFKGVLVRDRDVFLTLPARTEIAQQLGGDAFVSIHLNAAPSRTARGAEIFFLSPAGAEATAARLLANKESAARQLGFDGPDNEDVLYMILDVNQQAMMQRSSLLAESVLKSLSVRGLPPTRSVKQRSFAVLKSIAMPSVIIEAGFLTNAADVAVLGNEGGRRQVARSIAKGIVSYFKENPPPGTGAPRVVIHKVGRGETLWAISRKYNTTVAVIQKANKLGNSHAIRVGQELMVQRANETQ